MSETLPDVIQVTYPRARKAHACCECRLPIQPRERYQLVEGLWDGHWSRFRMCLSCGHWRDAVWDVAHRDYCPEEMPAFGELAEWLQEYSR